MQIQLARPSKRLVPMLLSVLVTKLVKGALDNILYECVAMGYTVFIGQEVSKMKGQVASYDVSVV